jgi:hypothetical protein
MAIKQVFRNVKKNRIANKFLSSGGPSLLRTHPARTGLINRFADGKIEPQG